MKLLGFNFNKINVEKLKDFINPTETLNVSTSIDIPEIREIKDHALNTPEAILEADFSYSVVYKPEIAKINLGGRIIFSIDQKQAKEIISQVKKKELTEDFKIPLYNTILKKAALKAMYLEEELNLPLHMPMPSFRKENKEK